MELLLSQTFTSHLLLSPLMRGFGNALLLFSLCFIGVHLAKIAARGWRLNGGNEQGKTPEPSAENKSESKTESKQPPQDVVYYIVEKKRRRSKPSYGEPKQIHFK